MDDAETASVRINEAVKLTGMPVGFAKLHDLQKVYLWDVGPERPVAPTRPALPSKGKEGDPEYDLAKIEFADALEKYSADLKAHAVRKADYALWEKSCGGPVEHEFWSIDATHALQNDAAAVKAGTQSRRRWYVSSRTRGSEKLKNRGLPEGMTPGKGQADLEDKRAAELADFGDAVRRDPHFEVTL